jgi:cytochrome P450
MIAVSTDPTAPQPLQDKDIIIEITNLIFAGTDTTGNTFSYLFWELAKHPEWQQRLRDELRGINFDYIPAYQEVMKLPVLDAVIQETLRFWPASPASLPRLTPSGGRIIDGVKVPGNVSIFCLPTGHAHL